MRCSTPWLSLYHGLDRLQPFCWADARGCRLDAEIGGEGEIRAVMGLHPYGFETAAVTGLGSELDVGRCRMLARPAGFAPAAAVADEAGADVGGRMVLLRMSPAQPEPAAPAGIRRGGPEGEPSMTSTAVDPIRVRFRRSQARPGV